MNDTFVPWPAAPEHGPLPLAGAATCVWAVSLTPGAERLAALESFLDEAERERASRFHFERHRRRYIAGRGALRALLGRYLNEEPRTLEISYGPFGKPTLAKLTAGLHFNVAHSEDLALVAFSRAGPVGVDVERVRPLQDARELVERFFSPRENELFRQLPEAEQPEAFFNLWTRKEAWLKATGEGIGRYLAQVEVSFLPGECAALLHVPENLQFGYNWGLKELFPRPGFAAALAIPPGTAPVQCWRTDATAENEGGEGE